MKKLGIVVCCIVLCLTFTPLAHAQSMDVLTKSLNVLKAVQAAFDAKAAPLTKGELISVITANSGPFDHSYLTDDRVNAINYFAVNNVYGTVADNFFGPPNKITPIIDIIEQVAMTRPDLFDPHPDIMGALQEWRDLVHSGSDGHNGMGLGESRTTTIFLLIIASSSTTSCVLEKCSETITREGCTADIDFAGTAYKSSGAFILVIPAGAEKKKVDCCGPVIGWGSCQIPGLETY